MSNFKIILERNMCTSCGNCVDNCPELWEIAEDGFSHLKKSKIVDENEELELDNLKCSLKAAKSCPVSIIHVYQDDEEIIS
jgi:ferredoxin